ncbi:hypothetical protein [Pelagibius sp.]|uniref:hypothetical protein n=1 Tax=Pelagibius sp. TaxID=1931238 RepID=UPI003B50764C
MATHPTPSGWPLPEPDRGREPCPEPLSWWRALPRRTAAFLRLFGAARRVAAAREYGRRPAPEDLETLGVDPDRFE